MKSALVLINRKDYQMLRDCWHALRQLISQHMLDAERATTEKARRQSLEHARICAKRLDRLEKLMANYLELEE